MEGWLMFEKLKDPHTQEVAKMWLRQGLQIISGLLIYAGYTKASTITDAQYETIAGVILSIATGIWMQARNTKSAIVANVDQYPEVKAVITNNTPEGEALAASVPSATVAVAAEQPTAGSKKK